MSWLRIDDGFGHHPKLMRLPRADRWTWLEVLCYCARYQTEGAVPDAVGEAVKTATPAFLNRCHELHLLDLNGDGYVVHDWAIYNPKDPTSVYRKRNQRARQRDATVTEPVTESGQERDASGTVTRARARAGARVPVPSLPPTAEGEGTGPGLDTPAPSPPPQEAAASTPPGRRRFECPYEYAGGIRCGESFVTAAELTSHLRQLGHEVGHEQAEARARQREQVGEPPLWPRPLEGGP